MPSTPHTPHPHSSNPSSSSRATRPSRPSPPTPTIPLARSSTHGNPNPSHNANIASSSTNPTLSPILAHRTQPHLPEHGSTPLSPTHPQYAEILTPLKLRRRKRHQPVSAAGPSTLPLTPGPSRQGFFTDEGDLYRGATYDPSLGFQPPVHPPVDEDAVTLGGTSTTSSSSSWSWHSDLERGRRVTMAVIERFGEALGVRRGSTSSGSSTHTSNESVVRKRSRRLSRSTTRDSSPDRPKRQHLPRRREFTLLLPPPDHLQPHAPLSRIPTPAEAISISSDDVPTPVYPPDRVITTPSLPTVLERIRGLRAAAGLLSDSGSATPGPDVPVRRGGSAPGRTRTRPRPTPTGSFANPPVPRPTASRAQSRLQALRGVSATDVPRPKSVSDLMGMANPYGSSTSLSAMKGSDFPMPSRTGTPTLRIQDDEPGLRKKKGRGCWWLDVACPGWEDLRDIGELLGLHPLTLEDVLQQDPREKLDVFDRLGYYFVVVRALDEGYFRYTPGSATSLVGQGQVIEKVTMEGSAVPIGSPEIRAHSEKKKEGRRRGWGMGRATGKHAAKDGEKVEIIEDHPGKEGLEGVGVGALNVYLVVFADGIVSFHFDDISKHTKRVLDRILSNASARESPGSDWVAHGLLDSIVDAFFPLCRYVDGEVDDIDSLTIDPSVDPKSNSMTLVRSPVSSTTAVDEEGVELSEKLFLDDSTSKSKKIWQKPPVPPRIPRLSLKRLKAKLPIWSWSLPYQFTYLRLFFLPTSSAVRRKHEKPDEQLFDRSTMLKRITDMRKLVTGLTRLLGAKSQVIGRMRKRAQDSGEGVEAYIGDVEDHILLLQTSLYHYEYILSHCQPAYLSHLSVSFTLARGGTDRAILALSTVTIGILPMQLMTGLFSMNANVPHNGDPNADGHEETDGSQSPFNFFAGIVVAIFLIACGLVSMIRWWRWSARVKWAKVRGESVPSTWDGYWGWK